MCGIGSYIILSYFRLIRTKKIKEEDQLIDLGINSIDYIKIVLVLESEFGFEFDDEALDMNNISNVRLLYQYICKKLSKD